MDACENVYSQGRFTIVEGEGIVFRTDRKLPFGVSCVQQTKFDSIILGMGYPQHLSAAVVTLHGSIYTRFIRLAANPAPKPLSMLTTVTPAAQELSMPKSAAMPWKLAP